MIALADTVAADGPLDILINNAAQTVRRSPGAYAPLVAGESAALPAGPVDVLTFGHVHAAGAAARALRGRARPSPTHPGRRDRPRAVGWVGIGVRIATGSAIDAGGLVPDLAATNSWVATVDAVDPIELLEVQLATRPRRSS